MRPECLCCHKGRWRSHGDGETRWVCTTCLPDDSSLRELDNVAHAFGWQVQWHRLGPWHALRIDAGEEGQSLFATLLGGWPPHRRNATPIEAEARHWRDAIDEALHTMMTTISVCALRPGRRCRCRGRVYANSLILAVATYFDDRPQICTLSTGYLAFRSRDSLALVTPVRR